MGSLYERNRNLRSHLVEGKPLGIRKSSDEVDSSSMTNSYQSNSYQSHSYAGSYYSRIGLLEESPRKSATRQLSTNQVTNKESLLVIQKILTERPELLGDHNKARKQSSPGGCSIFEIVWRKIVGSDDSRDYSDYLAEREYRRRRVRRRQVPRNQWQKRVGR